MKIGNLEITVSWNSLKNNIRKAVKHGQRECKRLNIDGNGKLYAIKYLYELYPELTLRQTKDLIDKYMEERFL